MPTANILDPLWVLDEATGRLRYERLRRVSRNPKREIVVEWAEAQETAKGEFVERMQRVAQDRKQRGVR